MKITIDVNKGNANVEMEVQGLRPTEAIGEDITASNALMDTYKKLIDEANMPESSENTINAFVNIQIKKGVDNGIPYKDDEKTKAVLAMAGLFNFILDGISESTLEKMKEEFEKMEDK